ncbi:MAG: hypothetical protein ACRD7E_04735, partial [Bryobacteraceae bacterium]
ALLSSGTVPAIVTRDSAGGFNSHGQAAVENSFLIDGIDNNSYGFALEDRKAQVVIDAVQEFKLQTSNYSAEFGRAAGGVMNVSIKSGSNQFHGTAYEYLRNDIFDARDTFSYVDRDGDGRADPAVLRQNQFGATFGGPIVKHRSFFFGSWEGLRLRQPQSFLETVPTADERAGRFLLPTHGTVMDPLTRQPFPGNIIPESRIDPVAARFVGLYPLPNSRGRAPVRTTSHKRHGSRHGIRWMPALTTTSLTTTMSLAESPSHVSATSGSPRCPSRHAAVRASNGIRPTIPHIQPPCRGRRS